MSGTYGYHKQPLHNLFLALHNHLQGCARRPPLGRRELLQLTLPHNPRTTPQPYLNVAYATDQLNGTQLVSGCWLLVAGCRLLAAGCRLPISCY